MAVKKTQMYRKNLDTSETNLYPLTEAQYVSMENGQTVQEILSDRDSDKYTPVITNSSSTFKVGQGDNVDLSSSMKEGAYDSCVLKGKTMVNCIQEPSSKDVVLPYEFADGRYVTINNTKESGALGVELKGQTLVNLVPKKIIDYTASSDWDGYHQLVQNSKQSFDEWRALQDLKPNTKYYISCYVETFEVVNNEGYCLNNPSVESIFGDSMIVNGVGRYQWLSTTKSELTDEIFMALRCQNALARGAIKIRDIMIIEYQQGMENWDISYFEGMASCKMPTLHTNGKNLLPYNEMFVSPFTSATPYITKNVATFPFTLGVNGRGVGIKFKVEPNTTYTLSSNVVVPNTVVGVAFYKNESDTTNYNNKLGIAFSTNIEESTKTFTTPNECNWIVCGVYILYTYEQSGGTVVISEMPKLQLEKNTQATTYEPHKSSILSLPEEVVLRSLPNGVCDTFNTRTGVYTQRIGEIVLDGSSDENWNNTSYVDNIETLTQFGIGAAIFNGALPKTVNNESVVKNAFIQNMFAVQKATVWIYQEGEACAIHMPNPTHGNQAIQAKVLRSRLSSQDVEGWRALLRATPWILQYELATPIVTKINLPSTLKSWNTTTHIYSEIPENTLYPTLSHSNPTYPVILKPSTKYSIVANSYSNSHTNSAINFNLGGATASTTVGNRVTTITTPSTLSNELLTMSGRGNKLNNVMVIEGDVVGDEPYFEGMCDSKSPILSNVGKNLFNGEIEAGRWLTYGKLEKYNTVTTGFRSANIITITPSSRYTISGNFKGSGYFVFGNKDGYVTRYIGLPRSSQSMSFNTNPDECYGVWYTVDIEQTEANKPANIQLEEASTVTAYEPYKSNTTTFDQKDGKTIVLRSLPNGVCDTLNVETGEYVQRIGEKLLNGDESGWYAWVGVENDTYKAFALGKWVTDSKTNSSSVKGNELSDHFLEATSTNQNGEWFMTHTDRSNGNMWIAFNVAKSKLVDTTIASFTSYLKQNPITVQYELETPVVSTVDIQGFPYAYTNGHVQLSSGHSGQSLTPKVEYSLSANKTGQINSNTKRVSAHQKQLDDFEAMMLTSMVQSAYDKAILQFDYEMQMMSLGGE